MLLHVVKTVPSKITEKLIEDEIRWISSIAGHGSENKLNHEFYGDEKTLNINEQSGKLPKNFLESCKNVSY